MKALLKLGAAAIGMFFACSAEAACTYPSGTYVGGGGGQAVLSNTTVTPPLNNTSFGGNSVSYTFTYTTSTKSVAGTILGFGKSLSNPTPQYILNSATGAINYNGGLTVSAVGITSQGTVTPFSVVTSNPTTLANFFNTTTCMGIISTTMSGTATSNGTASTFTGLTGT